MFNKHALSPLAAFAEMDGLYNVEFVEPIRNDYAEWNHIWQHGDLVLGHPEYFSSVPNKAVGDFIFYLIKNTEVVHLNDSNVVGMGHTHQAGKTWNDFGVVGMELGCLAATPDYAANPKAKGRPPVKGYSIFYQNRETGKTNINLSHFYQLD